MSVTHTSARECAQAVEIALDKLADALECSHEYDCPYAGNHKGALTWYESCECWVGEALRPMFDNLNDWDWGGECQR